MGRRGGLTPSRSVRLRPGTAPGLRRRGAGGFLRATACLSQDGRIVGLSILDGRTVDLMMVDPDHHRRGWGRLLLRHAEETLLARYSTIRLETFPDNAGAKSFYEACGWVLAERLDGEGPAKLVYTKSGTGD
ncbi:GNAT family N-acetyltransferase [Streptomyces anulatus]|uniref:GNAT family N-acetyltransferase n=1 Tax=Streptomyces TaxID=1883 RepID=UPI00211D8818|nr:MULTISPECIES: GNAT family N-acetyltransferase [Streptomyces]WSC62048.1 GNAT family N-acetyltransferase [Streptomyces anulatus]WTC71742.1 GNAT family N-acetyltransferase [Streptomyces anulatus]